MHVLIPPFVCPLRESLRVARRATPPSSRRLASVSAVRPADSLPLPRPRSSAARSSAVAAQSVGRRSAAVASLFARSRPLALRGRPLSFRSLSFPFSLSVPSSPPPLATLAPPPSDTPPRLL
jgi:hypothetical protein